MRPPIPDEVQKPYPIHYTNRIIAGFGRGSAELGIRTANVPVEELLNSLSTGIYFGWCRLSEADNANRQTQADKNKREIDFNNGMLLSGRELSCLPMVMSVGWNPFYNNQEKAAEIHIMNKFELDFYGAQVSLVILGYIRPELNYATKGMLFQN